MTVLHFAGERTGAEAFATRVDQVASTLWSLGLRGGDVLALMLFNEPLALELALASRRLGLIWCPINWHFRQEEVRHILQDSGASVLVVHAPLLEQMSEGIPAQVRVLVAAPHGQTGHVPQGMVSWDALCATTPRQDALPVPAPGSIMVYTSGTTGKPKGVRRAPLAPAQAQELARVTQLALGLRTGIRALVSAPLYHSAPASYIVQAVACDADIWLEHRFDAEHTLALIEAHRISHLYLVPTMAKRLLDLPAATRARYRLDSFEYVVSTGAPFPPDVKEAMIRWWGPVIHECYAATELGWVTHIDSVAALRKPGSVGRGLPGAQVRVLGPAGEPRAPGQVGAIHARLASAPDFTYQNNDSARRALERDGLLSLGDMGYLDDEGYLYVTGRYSDMVISGGVNIYPAEIEAALLQMEGVADCAVFGIPDPEFGESLLAVVQPSGPVAPGAEAVKEHLRGLLAGYKVPREVLFQAELPREDTGKIFKRKLRDPYWASPPRH